MKGDAFTPKMYPETKNIVTNFGKQMAAFAASDLALPYLGDIVKKLVSQGDNIKLSSFHESSQKNLSPSQKERPNHVSCFQ